MESLEELLMRLLGDCSSTFEEIVGFVHAITARAGSCHGGGGHRFDRTDYGKPTAAAK
jgi:hypothetical protein